MKRYIKHLKTFQVEIYFITHKDIKIHYHSNVFTFMNYVCIKKTFCSFILFIYLFVYLCIYLFLEI